MGSLLVISGVLTNVGLEIVSHSRQTRAETPDFPESEAELLHTIIEAEFLHPGVLHKAVKATTMTQEALSWTSYEYAVHVERQGIFTEIIYTLSEAVHANGGKIFQTYFQPEDQHASIAVGIDAFITHTVSITWDPLPEAPPPPVQDPSSGQYRAAIVIDDLGSSESVVQRLLDLGLDFTFSVLPHQEKSTQIASWLHSRQKEVLLHLPMEPQGYEYPGRGALLVRMPPEVIRSTIAQNLQTVPYAVGANNHMGSRLTANPEKIQIVLQTLQEHGLFFLDSRTTGRSVAYQTARQLGLKSAERKVFLDALPGYDFAWSQLQALAAMAEKGEPAIAIGHPKEATLRALEDMRPEFARRKIEIVRLSQFVQ